MNICLDCNEEMAVSAETSELVCQSCGATKALFGIAFDEAQALSQEGYTKRDLTLICARLSRNTKSWTTSIQSY